MHLTDHVTDVQLNDYLDHESSEQAEIESHLSTCDECVARLTALITLFAEIESLPELELTYSHRESSMWDAVRLTPNPGLTPQIPRWFTLTAFAQAMAGLISLVFTLPYISELISSVLQANPLPSFNVLAVSLQMKILLEIQLLQSVRFPPLPVGILPVINGLPAEVVYSGLVGVFCIWLIGSWWILKARPNPV